MRVVGGNLAANLRAAERMIGAAAKAGAQVVLLPEALDAGWTHPSGRDLADLVPRGHVCSAFCDAAQEHGLYVCAGLTERVGERVYNAAVLVSPKGQVLLHHRSSTSWRSATTRTTRAIALRSRTRPWRPSA